MDNLTIEEGFVGQRMVTLPAHLKLAFRENVLTRFFFLTDIGYYPNAQHHFRTRQLGANEYIFIYCIKGEGHVSIDGVEARLPPNHYIIIPKHTPHRYRTSSTHGWTIYWMHFDGMAASRLYERYRTLDGPAVAVPYVQRHIDKFNEAYETFSGSTLMPRLEYACISCLDFLKSFIYRSIGPSRLVDQHETLVNNVKAYLMDNLDRSLTAREIANQFEYSPSHLSVVFKQHTGYSPIAFLSLKKVQRACEYLAYTNLSIKEISFKVAFEDPLYFSRVFKKYMGVSPREYRRTSSAIDH